MMTKRLDFDDPQLMVHQILPASDFYATYYNEADGTLFWGNLVGWALVSVLGEKKALRPLDYVPDVDKRGDVDLCDTRKNFLTIIDKPDITDYVYMEQLRQQAQERWLSDEEELKPTPESQYNVLSDKYQKLLQSVAERPMARYNDFQDYFCLYCYGHGTSQYEIKHLDGCLWLECQQTLDSDFPNGADTHAD